MRDLVFVLVAVGFFVVAAAYIRGCAALVGSSDDVRPPETDALRREEVRP